MSGQLSVLCTSEFGSTTVTAYLDACHASLAFGLHALAKSITEEEETRVGGSVMIDDAYVSHKIDRQLSMYSLPHTTFVL